MKKQTRAWPFLLAFVLAFVFGPVPASAASVSSSAAPGSSSAVSIVNGYTAEQVEQILKQQSSSRASSSASSVVSSQQTGSSRRSVSSGSSAESSSGVSSGSSSEPSSGTAASEESSSEISLPSVDSVPEDNPLSSVIVDTNANRKLNWIGIVSWVCIALGILVVLAVVFSNRRPPRGGSGRSRYRKPNRSKKKHLLNDKYYRHTRY